MGSPTPILVVGMNRTGTKWVSNIICSHIDVFGAQSERSRGILETNMFGIMQEKFDLSFPDEYVALIELWSMTELFKCAKGDKLIFYSLSPRPRNALTLFERLMSDAAISDGKQFWIQKTSPMRALHALKYFKGARVVITRRGLIDTLRSSWAAHLRYRPRKIIRSTYAYVRQEKILDKISRDQRAVEVRYENLVANSETESIRLFECLSLDPSRITSTVTYAKNTSFSSDKDRALVMSAKERQLVIFTAGLFRLVPLSLMMFLSSLTTRLFYNGPATIIPGSLGPLVDQLADRSRDS